MTNSIRRSLFFIVITLFFSAFAIQAQEVVVPLKDNHVQREAALKRWYSQKLMKASPPDTLKLPFFDDFWYVSRQIDSNTVHPFENNWLTKHCFINNTMAVSPPSIGVATFDGLNENGVAFIQGSNNNRGERADTLLSRAINLAGYTNDTNVFLSFFYQPQGLGDAPEADDSLVLEFKAQNNTWVKQWGVAGTKLQPFQQVILQVKDTFLHAGFQLRFIGRASRTGNLDHWHLDYVFMDKGRSAGDTVHKDVALIYQPHSILKEYFAMPARQFRNSISLNRDALKTDYSNSVKNLYNQDQNVNFGFQVQYPDGGIFAPASNPNLVIQQNVSAFGIDTFKININPQNDFNTAGVSDKQFDLKVKNILRLGGQVSAHPENDTSELTQKFRNYYAYDDGTAEAGYGLINAKAGQVALGFKLNIADTLYGIAIHFNQSEEDVRNSIFSLYVWEDIAADQRATNDKIIARLDDLIPQYEEGFGYHYFRLENPVPLGVGSNFFVGWNQNREFLLNVGLDINYTLISGNKANPHLLFNVEGTWKKSEIFGTPMIRPVFGREPYLSVKEAEKNKTSNFFNPQVFPNPSQGNIQIILPSEENSVTINLYDITGKMVDAKQRTGKTISMNYSEMPKGIYLLRIIERKSGNFYTHRLILE